MTNAELEDVEPFNTYAHSGTQMSRDPIVWRYLDLLSLLALLHDEKLHFSRLADLQMEDPNEGTGGLLTDIVNRPITPSTRMVPSNPETDRRNQEEVARIEAELRTPLAERLPTYREKVAQWDMENRNVHVSCWHTSGIESDFMWRLYAKREFGLAIVSSAQSVVEALGNDDVSLNKIGWAFVVYPTWDERIRNGIEARGSATAFIVKAPEFRSENEFRIFVKTKDNVEVCGLRVDVKHLIKQIRLSPMLPDWAENPLLQTLNPICKAKGIPLVEGRKPKLRSRR